MLLFLPGVGEIQRVLEQLTERGGGCHSLPAVWRVALKRTAQSDPPGAGREAQSGAGHQYCRDQFDHRGGSAPVVDSAQERVARFDPHRPDPAGDAAHQPGIDDAACRTRRSSPRGSACICSAKNRRNGRRRRASRRSCTAICRRCCWSCCSGAATIRPRWPSAGSAARGQSGRRAPPAGGVVGAGRRAAVGVWPQMAALGNEPRLAMLAAAQTDDEAVTAAKLAAILEEAPRGGLWIWGRLSVSRPTGSSDRSS